MKRPLSKSASKMQLGDHPSFETAELNLLGPLVAFSGLEDPKPPLPIDRWVTDAIRKLSIAGNEDGFGAPNPYRYARQGVLWAILQASFSIETNEHFSKRSAHLKSVEDASRTIAEAISRLAPQLDEVLIWRTVLPPSRFPAPEGEAVNAESKRLIAGVKDAEDVFRQLSGHARELAERQKPFRNGRDVWLLAFCDAMLDVFYYLFSKTPGAPETSGFQEFVADAYRSALGTEEALPDSLSAWIVRGAISLRKNRPDDEQPDRFFHPNKKLSHAERKRRETMARDFQDYLQIQKRLAALQHMCWVAEKDGLRNFDAELELAIIYVNAAEGVQKLIRTAHLAPKFAATPHS